MVDLEVERVGELLAVGAAGLDEEAVLDVALEYEGVRLHWMTNFAIWQMKTKHKKLHIFLHFVKGNFMFIYLLYSIRNISFVPFRIKLGTLALGKCSW